MRPHLPIMAVLHLLLLVLLLLVPSLAYINPIIDDSAQHAKDYHRLVSGSNTCSVTDFGAVGDNKTDCTTAIQTALDKCAAQYPSGAVVVFPNGGSGANTFRISASVALPSHTTLAIDAGASLFSAQTPASPAPADPRCGTSYWKNTAILCTNGTTDITIVGEDWTTSVIDGGGWPWYEAKLFGQGPRLFETAFSSKITLSHVTFTNSPSWTVHPTFSVDILADHINILNPRFTPNTDGFDPDSCAHVELVDSFIDTGDDGISIKSSNVSHDVQVPAQDIHIHRSVILSRNICVGSATYGGVYDVMVEDTVVGDDKGSSPWAIKYKSHQYYPGAMVNHTYRNMQLGKIAPNSWQQPHGGTAFIIHLSYGDKPPSPVPACPPSCPRFADIRFVNITVDGAVTAGDVGGTPRDPLQSITFQNITFKTEPEHGWSCVDVETFTASGNSPSVTCKKPLETVWG